MPPEGSKRKIKVIKVKSEVPINEIYPANFPVMPRLYLELIENKKKVIPELRKVEFISKNGNSSNVPSYRDVRDSAQKELSAEIGQKLSEDPFRSRLPDSKESNNLKKSDFLAR